MMEIKEMEERLQSIFPEWKYEIIEFIGMKKPFKIKCCNCGEILEFKKASDIFRRINACKCKKYFKNNHEKIKYLCEHYGFELIYDGVSQEKKRVKCLKCGLEMERSTVSILNTPWHCDNCNNYRKGKSPYSKETIQQKLNEQFNNEYELLEYVGLKSEAVIKHNNCGFIFKIRELSDIFCGRNRGCPKCYQFKSCGEKAIRDFLERNNINYIPQKTFAPLNKSKYRFDFYLPDINLAIEYQGEQHYRDNGFFKDKLSTIQQRDNIKKQYCLENNIELLEIKYTDLKKIPEILTSRLNDYLERE